MLFTSGWALWQIAMADKSHENEKSVCLLVTDVWSAAGNLPLQPHCQQKYINRFYIAPTEMVLSSIKLDLAQYVTFPVNWRAPFWADYCFLCVSLLYIIFLSKIKYWIELNILYSITLICVFYPVEKLLIHPFNKVSHSFIFLRGK